MDKMEKDNSNSKIEITFLLHPVRFGGRHKPRSLLDPLNLNPNIRSVFNPDFLASEYDVYVF